jgi:hypothetical protein
MVGEYARLKGTSDALRGTITDSKTEAGDIRYLFHHDRRFNDDRLPDFWVTESDIEVCARPTDVDVARIKVSAS